MYEGMEQVMDALKEQNISMAIVSNKADDAVKDLAKYYFAKYIYKSLSYYSHHCTIFSFVHQIHLLFHNPKASL